MAGGARFGGVGVRGVPVPEVIREQLIERVCAGSSCKSASAALGVSHQSGMRIWRRFGHVELKPVTGTGGLPGPALSSDDASQAGPGRRRLTSEDRATIQAGLRLSLSQAAIAKLLGRNKSVVS